MTFLERTIPSIVERWRSGITLRWRWRRRALVAAAFALLARPRATLADEPAAVVHRDVKPQNIVLTQPLPPPVLAVEVLAALRAWTKQPDDALRPWAAAIADGTATRREAITLASIGANESQMLPWVLDGRCNDAAWRASRTGWERGSCDGGWAVGFAQRHNRKLLGAPPDEQVRDAVVWLRAWPQAWTTWRSARSQSETWLRQE